MKKGLVSYAIILCLIFSLCQTVFAIEAWLPGEVEYTLKTENIISQNNVVLSGDNLNFAANGDVTYELYVPFDVASIDVDYESSENVTFSIVTDDATEQIDLSAGSKSYSYTLNTVVRKGEKTIKFSANKAITVKSILLTKKKVQTTKQELYLCELSDNEDAIKTAVILDTKATMIMVNGAKRYIDNNNVNALSENIDGHIYLPIHTLARALGYYYENIPDKNYVLLRLEDKEFKFLNGVAQEENYLFDAEAIKNPIKYINGEAYAPLRYFAEVIGKTVGYSDGIVVIDDKYSVHNILNTPAVFSYVKQQFANFRPSSSVGTTYYVAQTANASDENEGSASAPFLTLNKAGKIAKAGDTVIVCEGVYRESLSVLNNGTPTKPITFIAKEGDDVVISATETISGFTADPERPGVYKAPISWNLGDGRNQIFMNNESLVEARYPNGPIIHSEDETISKNWLVKGDFQVVEEDNYQTVVSDTLLNQDTVDYWKGAYYIACRGSGYRVTTARVSASENGKLKLTEVTSGQWDRGQGGVWNFGYLAGHINCLDEAGEWIIKDGQIYLIPPKDANIQNLKVEVKNRQTVLDLSSNEYVQIKNINMFGGGIKMNNSEMCMISGCEIKYNNHFILSQDQADGYIEDGNESDPKGAVKRGEVGIYVGGRNNVFVNNTIKEAAGAAIYGSGAYMYIENNVIDSCGYAGSYVAGLTFIPNRVDESHTALRGGHSIYQNTVFNAGRSAVNFNHIRGLGIAPFLPSEIAYNDFHDGMLASLDTGIVYAYCVQMGHEKLKTRFHNNYVYYSKEKSSPYGMGIYWDGSTQNIESYDNVVFSTDDTVYEYKVFTQTASDAFAACDVWNNSIHLAPVYGGPSALEPEDFPYERPFLAGAVRSDNEYLENYNRSNTTKHVYAKDANLTRCTVEEDNSVSFNYSSAYNWIEFKDVDFGQNGSNRLLIDFYGDKYNTGDILTLVIGDSAYTGVSYELWLNAKAESKDQINTFEAAFEKITGKTNVYIKGNEVKSAKIVSIMPYLYTFDPGELNASRIYGGTFTDFVPASQYGHPQRRFIAPGDGDNPVVNSTYQDSVLEYKNVVFDETVSTVSLSAAATTGSAGQKMLVHLGSPDSEPVGEVEISPSGDWNTYITSEAELFEDIPAGTYDVYLTFESWVRGATCNLYWFAFN